MKLEKKISYFERGAAHCVYLIIQSLFSVVLVFVVCEASSLRGRRFFWCARQGAPAAAGCLRLGAR